MRRCGAAEYDLRTSFAELVLESEHPFLIHGSVADIVANAQRIADVLRAAAIAFVLECYAEGGALIMQLDA